MSKTLASIRRILSPFAIPIGLLGVCFVTYGILAPRLGFYLDDWYIVYYQKLFGAAGFINFFKGDRPLLAYVYMVFAPIFQDSRMGWQLFAVFTHWLAAVGFWFVLTKLMPKQKTTATIAAFLFVVYPGFQFQWFSVMYSQVYFLMAVYFLSYILMILAVKREHGKVPLMAAAVVSVMVGVVPMEYFYGLELLRPFVLWIVIDRSAGTWTQRIKKIIVYWLPFLAFFIAFPFFRSLFSHAFSYQINIINEFRQAPLSTLTGLLSRTFWSLFDANLTVWGNILSFYYKHNLLSAAYEFMAVLILVSFVISYLTLRRQAIQEGIGEIRLHGKSLMGLGILASLVAMIPYVAAAFDVSLDFPNNRFLLSLAPGTSLFLTGLIVHFIQTQKQKIILCSILIGLATGSQFLAARSFQIYWNEQQDFFWQLTWRAPQIQPNTLLATYDLHFSKYFSGPSLTAPLNLIYAPENKTNTLPFVLVMTSTPQESSIPGYENNLPIHYSFRNLTFSGNTSAMVVFYKPNNGCLHVLSPSDTPDEIPNSDAYDFYKSAIPLSNLKQIVTQPAAPSVPPEKYYGKEDTNQWCYFYEKASLALQMQDVNQVINLYKKAENAGFTPGSPDEWLPLIEANLRLGRVDQAVSITRGIAKLDPTDNAGVCHLWSGLAQELHFNADNLQKSGDLLAWAGC